MSVWPDPAITQEPALAGTEGELVAATIAVEPELLESLLDTLSKVHFPVNPQIYHNAAVVYVYPEGREESEPTTIVEFPAYRDRLHEVRDLLSRRGFAAEALWSKNLLDDIHSDSDTQAAPTGAPWVRLIRRKHRPRTF